jgi:hypothetical protein
MQIFDNIWIKIYSFGTKLYLKLPVVLKHVGDILRNNECLFIFNQLICINILYTALFITSCTTNMLLFYNKYRRIM